jgi:hypothetical protein
MKRALLLLALLSWLGSLRAGTAVTAQSPTPTPARVPPLILPHYLPWYEAKPFSPRWGWHWTMNAFNPDRLAGGQREIASHYHPLIGPYDSADPAVLEYHALLMRLAGIDGVVADWYGREDYLDYGAVHRNTAALARHAARAGLKLAVCYEDQTIPKLVAAGRLPAGERVKHARGEIEWLREHWFREPSYVTLDRRPLLLSFGSDGLTAAEWEQALADLPEPPLYLSEHHRRSAASGAFDWPIPQAGLPAQDAFYREARGWPAAMAVAFPRFHDIYAEARVHPSWGRIADDDGKTFTATLEKALRSGLPLVQVCTWNDWGEGTMVEPSVEFGYRDLEAIQRLRKQWLEPGFAGAPADLRLPHRLYQLRKARPAPVAARELDEVGRLLARRSIAAARAVLDRLERLPPPAGGQPATRRSPVPPPPRYAGRGART